MSRQIRSIYKNRCFENILKSRTEELKGDKIQIEMIVLRAWESGMILFIAKHAASQERPVTLHCCAE